MAILGPYYQKPLIEISINDIDTIYRYIVIEIMLGKIITFSILSILAFVGSLYKRKNATSSDSNQNVNESLNKPLLV